MAETIVLIIASISLGVELLLLTIMIASMCALSAPWEIFEELKAFLGKHRYYSLERLCRDCKLSPERAREMYYKRINREEAFRRKSVWDFLKQRGETEQDYFTMRHAIVERDENGTPTAVHFGSPDPRDRIPAMKMQFERFCKLGLFPDEESREYRCEKCRDSGNFFRLGKVRRCSCWKKPVKKWLLDHRNRLEAEERDPTFL